MKRSDFLKRIGMGLGVAVVAPQVLADIPTKEKKTTPGKEFVFDWNSGTSKYPPTLRHGDHYHKGDVFFRNGWKYVCISKGFTISGEKILKLRPLTFTPNPDVNVLVSDLRSFRHTKESCLIKFKNG